MLKGHVQIDIHNHNSGFTERYEQDNLITDALKYIIPNYIGGNLTPNAANGIMPLATRALGGLMLFDGTLTEDAANIHFPSDVHLVAFAQQGTNTDNPLMGSINASESKALDTGYQNVWDFSTSQANGTIQSIALTNYLVNPFVGFNNSITIHGIMNASGYRSPDSTNSYATPLVYDSDKQEIYFIMGDGSFSGSGNSITYTATVYKEYLPTNKYKVADKANVAHYPESVVDISFSYNRTISSMSDRYFIFNGHDGYAYYVFVQSNASGNGTITYFSIKTSDYSFTVSDPVTVTVTNTALKGGATTSIISNGKLFVTSYSGRYIYIIDLSNTASIKTVDFGQNAVVQNFFYPKRNGCIEIYVRMPVSGSNLYNYYRALVYPDGTMLVNGIANLQNSNQSQKTVNGVMIQNDNLMAFGKMHGDYQYGSGSSLCTDYLGSICNLTSAVQKTAASSMKVTYTLTDEDGTL